MNILSIGNSFSEDATRYFHQVAKANGKDITSVSLFIGGCPLSTHYRNMLTGKEAYNIGYNGMMTGFYTSLENALLNRDWDFITFQQVSNLSPKYDTYQPYLNELSEYVSMCCPKAKQVIHQTWAYENGSDRLTKELGYSSPDDMFNDIKKSYEQAAKDINAEFIIPSGEIMLKLEKSGLKAHRDTFHASLGVGRYVLALLWYKTFTGDKPDVNLFNDFDETISKEELSIIESIL